MQKIGAYVIILVIGVIIGVSSITYIVLNQDPQRRILFRPVEVTNIRFYTVASTDYIELIVQNRETENNQVDTVYVGNTPSNLVAQTSLVYEPNSQIVAVGSTLKITTKEGQEIGFSEVGSLSPSIGWRETNELAITQLTFNAAAGEVDNITASVTNSGTSDALLL